MNKAVVMKWANLALMISAAIQIATSLIMFFRLFPARISEVVELHKHNGMVFIILIFIHFYLNRGWAKANFFKKG
jgi:hypothetical protein